MKRYSEQIITWLFVLFIPVALFASMIIREKQKIDSSENATFDWMIGRNEIESNPIHSIRIDDVMFATESAVLMIRGTVEQDQYGLIARWIFRKRYNEIPEIRTLIPSSATPVMELYAMPILGGEFDIAIPIDMQSESVEVWLEQAQYKTGFIYDLRRKTYESTVYP